MKKSSVSVCALWVCLAVAAMAAHAAELPKTPLGRAAEVVQAYFDALGRAQPDFAAAEKLLVQSPAVPEATVRRYMKSFADAAQEGPRIFAENAIGDCAAVLFLRPGTDSLSHSQPVWLIRQDGGWKLSPRITTWVTIRDVLNDGQLERIHELEEWVKQVRSARGKAIPKGTPDLGSSPAEPPATDTRPDSGKLETAKGMAADGTVGGSMAAEANPAEGTADSAAAENPLMAASRAQSAAVQAEAEQRKRDDEAVHERLATELEAYEPYLRAIGEEVFRRASHNFALDNFYDPGAVALLVVQHHLELQQDPRLQSDDPDERAEAKQEADEREQKARAQDSDYITLLMVHADRDDAVAPERVRAYGRSKTRELFYLDVARGEMTQAQLDGIEDCVGTRMLQLFEQQAASSMKFIDRNFSDYVSACRQGSQAVAGGGAQAAPEEKAQASTAAAGQQEAPAAAQNQEQEDEEKSPAEEVDRAVEKAKKVASKLHSLFDH